MVKQELFQSRSPDSTSLYILFSSKMFLHRSLRSCHRKVYTFSNVASSIIIPRINMRNQYSTGLKRRKAADCNNAEGYFNPSWHETAYNFSIVELRDVEFTNECPLTIETGRGRVSVATRPATIKHAADARGERRTKRDGETCRTHFSRIIIT